MRVVITYYDTRIAAVKSDTTPNIFSGQDPVVHAGATNPVRDRTGMSLLTRRIAGATAAKSD